MPLVSVVRAAAPLVHGRAAGCIQQATGLGQQATALVGFSQGAICALALGDDTAGVSTREGLRLTARGNHFHHITGPAPVVAFEDTEDCRFVGNRITDCDVNGLIVFEGAAKDNVRPEVRNNILKANRVKGQLVDDSQ